MRQFLLAVGLLAGTIMGAGIFSLPYVFRQVGTGLGTVYLVAFALIYFVIHWRYAQVLHANQAGHHFFYFAKKYLPQWAARLASFTVLGGLLFTLTVYLILSASFANIAFNGFSSTAVIMFWLLGSVFIFVRTWVLGVAEIVGIGGIALIVLVILFTGGVGTVDVPVIQPVSIPLLLLPFGPLLFAFAARSAIPKVYEVYRSAREKFSLKRAIFWGTMIPIVVYLFFVVGVLRLVPDVAPDTISSLGFLSPTVMLLIGVMGLLTLWTSYIMIGSNVFDILRTDVFKSRWASGIVAVFAPLTLYTLGIQNFLAAVSITGGIFLALEASFVMMIWAKAEPRRYVVLATVPLYIIFAVGAAYEVVRFVF